MKAILIMFAIALMFLPWESDAVYTPRQIRNGLTNEDPITDEEISIQQRSLLECPRFSFDNDIKSQFVDLLESSVEVPSYLLILDRFGTNISAALLKKLKTASTDSERLAICATRIHADKDVLRPILKARLKLEKERTEKLQLQTCLYVLDDAVPSIQKLLSKKNQDEDVQITISTLVDLKYGNGSFSDHLNARLNSISDESIVVALLDSLSKPDSKSVEKIRQLYGKAKGDPSEIAFGFVLAKLTDDQVIFRDTVKILGDKSKMERSHMTVLLGVLPTLLDDHFSQLICNLMDDPDPVVAIGATRIAIFIAPACHANLPKLLQRLSDTQNEELFDVTAEAVRMLGDEETIPELNEILNQTKSSLHRRTIKSVIQTLGL